MRAKPAVCEILEVSPQGTGRGEQLITHFHLAPRLRISGAIPLLPIHIKDVDTELHNFSVIKSSLLI
jgi:hypothetical protein